MGLKLQTVPAARGYAWVAEGLKEFFRQPLSYTMLLMLFMLAVLIVSAVPVLGGVLVFMATPLLTLAYVMAVQQRLAGQPVRVALFGLPWSTSPPETKRALLTLCGAYTMATLLAMWAADLIDNGSLSTLFDVMANPDMTDADKIRAAEAPGLLYGMAVRVLAISLLSVPFWHAPPLVYYGRQSAWQALFSSTLAVWRSRGAFLLYGLTWAGLVFAVAAVAMVLVPVFGNGSLVSVALMPISLALSVTFYVTVYFTFVDSFGDPKDA